MPISCLFSPQERRPTLAQSPLRHTTPQTDVQPDEQRQSVSSRRDRRTISTRECIHTALGSSEPVDLLYHASKRPSLHTRRQDRSPSFSPTQSRRPSVTEPESVGEPEQGRSPVLMDEAPKPQQSSSMPSVEPAATWTIDQAIYATPASLDTQEKRQTVFLHSGNDSHAGQLAGIRDTQDRKLVESLC